MIFTVGSIDLECNDERKFSQKLNHGSSVSSTIVSKLETPQSCVKFSKLFLFLQDKLELQLINAMHTEFKELKEKIIKLEVTISVQQIELTKHHREVRELKTENDFLRNHVSPDILVQLSKQKIELPGDNQQNSDFNILISQAMIPTGEKKDDTPTNTPKTLIYPFHD